MSVPAETTPPTLYKKNLITAGQNQAVTFAYENDYALLSMPMGYGKTVITLTAMAELLAEKVLSKILVVAPARVRDMVWMQEYQRWEHTACLNVTCYPDTSGDVVVTSFNQLKETLSADTFDGLVVDELTKLKSAGGEWFKALRKYIPAFRWRIGLTGSVADEGLTHVYSMCMVIDGGKAFGRNKDAFLRRYFHATDYNQYNWEPNPGAREAIAARMAPFTFIAETDDQGRPPLMISCDYVDLPEEARKAYASMCADMVVEVGDATAAAVNAAVLSGKLQQLCNGFVYSVEGEPIAMHDAKLAALRKTVDRINGPVVIVYQWKEELARLRSQYPGAHVLGDGVSKAKAENSVALWNAREIDVLLVHPMSAGHGLNIQYGGSNLIFLGPIWSRDQTEQLVARLWRRGQRDAVQVTYLLARNTVEDCVIMPRVLGKGDEAAAFMEHLNSATSRHTK
jgi:hypothetical protein